MPLIYRKIGIGGTSAAKAIANKRMAFFSMYKLTLEQAKKLKMLREHKFPEMKQS